ncbi:30S ribosomal protein S4 [Botrimarina hoheduenensis]|uniref:Small ribosomal subunit protein uS4 n=1 Tax=Botrimarina hoheduenensis TaxID=2528000 RepID=A0A5C5W806_9BACT|nr:30S ribosomal protein S4 [Botrimarina hoheduenensis]TWT46577.1 30S ribosomal protein S4 [Botrimarina hoheduenensis]
MARYTGPVCRLCRRDGAKLFLKGTRCDSPKCAFERRNTPPGQQQSARRNKQTDYGIQLREKQKVKHYYGILEKQFRLYFDKAERAKGNTGDVLLSLLERRLDNVVHRLGFGSSRSAARQLVRHGHVTLNGHKCTIGSAQVRAGDVVRVKNKLRSLDIVRAAQADTGGKNVPDFLSITESQVPEGIVGRLPGPEDVSLPIDTQLIIELCSR